MKAATRKSPIAGVSHSQHVNSLIPRGGEGEGEGEGMRLACVHILGCKQRKSCVVS